MEDYKIVIGWPMSVFKMCEVIDHEDLNTFILEDGSKLHGFIVRDVDGSVFMDRKMIDDLIEEIDDFGLATPYPMLCFIDMRTTKIEHR